MVVCAPAGFGKTIALAGWLHEDPRLCAWVSLDALDSDLVSFISVLVAALGTVVPHAGRRALVLAAQTQHPALSQLSALLADDLAVLSDELVIVLDDFHVIQEASVHVLLSLLVRRLPPTIQLVIASREVSPLPVALLRGRRELAELHADDLRFDRAEAMAFVRGMSTAPLDLRVVADAVDRSEGWAVGLRLLTLVSPPSDFPQFGPMLASRERHVVDAYLLEQVLSRQAPELRRFLTQTSILDRFCGPLCEAVVDGLQPGDGKRLLDESMAAGLFLTSLDDERRWYRFHHLFRDMLRRCLERDAGPEPVRALRARASDWFAGEKLWDEAATQAIDANDLGRVTSLVESCLLSERSIGVGLMLESWTRRLPRDVVDSSPTFLLVRCARLDIQGEVEELGLQLRRIDAMIDEDPSGMSPAFLPIARGQIEMQLAWVLHQMGSADSEALAHLERALDLLPNDQYDQRSGAIGMYAITLQCLGRTGDALAWISDQFGQGTALHPDYIHRFLIAQLYVEVASGQLPAAVQTGRRMVAFGTANQQPLAIGWGHFAQGWVAYEWNDLDGAREHFEAVLALGRDAIRMCSVYATLGLARTRIARGERGVAERLVLAELEQAEEAGNGFFVEGLRSFMARLALASYDLDRAVDWLTGVAFTRQGTTGFDVEDPLLTRARVLVARATPENLGEASIAVDRAIDAAESRHVVTSLVGALALRAVVEHARGEMARAAGSIARALEIAEPGQYTRTFVDLGPPLTGLLAELASQGGLPKGGRRVLMACRSESVVPASGLPSQDRAAPSLVEALTWRERDVLLLMDGQFSTREIARLLGIPEQTVRRYAANLYSKLQVTGPRDAVFRAYDLGFLHPEDRETPPSD